MVEILPEHRQLDLVLHTAVDHKHLQGAGIGVVQRAECPSTGTLKNDRIPGQELKYSYSRQELVTNNIKTATRAHMLAMLHALGLASRTVQARRQSGWIRKIIIYSNLHSAVQAVNHHITQNIDSLQDVASTSDRSLIKKVVTKVRKLSRVGLEVAILASCEKDKGGERARTLARQKGGKSRKSRRLSQLVIMQQ